MHERPHSNPSGVSGEPVGDGSATPPRPAPESPL
jgi:hypothetical protein